MWDSLPTGVWVLFGVLAFVLVLVGLGYWGLQHGLRKYPLRCYPDETYVIQTSDGWSLPLFRWHPNPEAPKQATPVVLCHGLGVNHLNMDLDDDLSLARYLRDLGWECWVASLRSGYDDSIASPEGQHRPRNYLQV